MTWRRLLLPEGGDAQQDVVPRAVARVVHVVVCRLVLERKNGLVKLKIVIYFTHYEVVWGSGGIHRTNGESVTGGTISPVFQW